VVELLSRPFAGKGSFEDNLRAFGFGSRVACLASLLHLPDSFLAAIGVIDLRAYEIALSLPPGLFQRAPVLRIFLANGRPMTVISG
jgi:hypothetical protein